MPNESNEPNESMAPKESSESADPPRSALRATTILAAAWVLMPPLMGFLLLAKIGAAADWLGSLGSAGPWVFAAFFALASGLGLLPTYAQSFVGGWVLGFKVGLPAALGGFLGGALIGYLIARMVSRDSLERRIDSKPEARVVREALVGRGFWRTLLTVTLVRLPPTSPFSLTNLALAGGGVPLPTYALGTLVGMAPRTAVVIAAGAAGAAAGARDIQELMKATPAWQIIAGIVATIAVLAILGAIGKAALRKAGIGTGTAAA